MTLHLWSTSWLFILIVDFVKGKIPGHPKTARCLRSPESWEFHDVHIELPVLSSPIIRCKYDLSSKKCFNMEIMLVILSS